MPAFRGYDLLHSKVLVISLPTYGYFRMGTQVPTYLAYLPIWTLGVGTTNYSALIIIDSHSTRQALWTTNNFIRRYLST